MKTRKQYFCKSLFLLIFISISLAGYGQEKKLQKTYSWSYKANEEVDLSFNNYNSDLNIKTWDKPVIEYKLHLVAKGANEDDVERLDSYLKNMTFSNSPERASIDMKFWKRRTSIMNRTKLKLENEKEVVLTEFKVKGELTIPKKCNLDLTSKYSDIELTDVLGKLILKLYNDKLYGGKVDNEIVISDKYSTIEFSDIKMGADITLYNSDFEANSIGDAKFESKYSKVFINTSGSLKVDGYNDKYNFATTGDVDFTAKYSGFRSEKSGKLKADCYNCTVVIDQLEDIDLVSKYTKFEFVKGGKCNISASYNDGINSTQLETLQITESKYGTFKIDKLSDALSVVTGYNDKFIILETGDNFKSLKVNGKYEKITIGIPANLDYRFKANVKYPKLDINEGNFTYKTKIVESSTIKYDAVKGKEYEGMPEIKIEGYDISLSIIYN